MSSNAPVKRLPSPQSTSSCSPHVTASVFALVLGRAHSYHNPDVGQLGGLARPPVRLAARAWRSSAAYGQPRRATASRASSCFFSEKRLRRQEHVSAGPSYGCGSKNEGPNRAKNENAGCLTAAKTKRAKRTQPSAGLPDAGLPEALNITGDERERANASTRPTGPQLLGLPSPRALQKAKHRAGLPAARADIARGSFASQHAARLQQQRFRRRAGPPRAHPGARARTRTRL